ncbi:MAG: hypothetical protein ABSE73_19835, partial [Planctomycetota bacterium]
MTFPAISVLIGSNTMTFRSILVLTLLFTALCAWRSLAIGAEPAAADAKAVLEIDFQAPTTPVSPILHGLMTEEINYSYDGGLYAELIRNR